MAGDRDAGKTNKLYAVAVGRKTEIFTKWSSCHQQMNGFSGECYVSCENVSDAVTFLMDKGVYKHEDDILVFENQTAISLKQFKDNTKGDEGPHEQTTTATAPTLADINNITVLQDLSGVDDQAYPRVFMDHLNVIYHYSVADIHSEISKQSKDTLSTVHQVLCEKITELFPSIRTNVSSTELRHEHS